MDVIKATLHISGVSFFLYMYMYNVEKWSRTVNLVSDIFIGTIHSCEYLYLHESVIASKMKRESVCRFSFSCNFSVIVNQWEMQDAQMYTVQQSVQPRL